MKIEVGKFYKTRDGSKVGPMKDRTTFLQYEGLHYAYDGECCYMGKSGEYTYPYRDLISEWKDTPEVGTLQEIGAQVGDVVALVKWGDEWYSGKDFARGKHYTVGERRLDSGYGYFNIDCCGDDKHFRIISRAQPKPEQTGPVRTVTRTTREIVPGVYGSIEVSDNNADGVRVKFPASRMSVDELTAAIDTLTAIRDALKENGE